ncbi:hypothetical protein FOG48_02435 [Hanseniaspora uvarum]|nr:hypothetical protein FOG48_02435 [Hanseniaspora uvarum]
MWFTLEQKVELYKISLEHPNWTQDDLASWFQRTYHSLKKPSQTTISRILNNGNNLIVQLNAKQNGSKVVKSNNPVKVNKVSKPKKQPKPIIPVNVITSIEEEEDDFDESIPKRQNNRSLQNQKLRKILQEWIYQTSWNSIPITFPILKDTAASIWQKLPLEKRTGKGFFSYKWLLKFLEKCQIDPPSQNKSFLELNKPKKIWSYEERDTLKNYLSKIPKKDLFTLDETLLAYNLPLDKSYYGISKLKRQIEIMTIMFCCNVDASEKLNPLIIGKYENYQCFKSEFGMNKDDFFNDILNKYDIEYYSNKESFLTSTIFHNWLMNWDDKLKLTNRQIYIILDDCCSHRISNIKLTNITLIYTRSQNKFLPFNWGIIDEFKTKYRQQTYQALIDLQNTITTLEKSPKKVILTFQQSKINIINAFKLIKKSWESITEASIMASWKASGTLPKAYINLNKPISMGLKKSDIFINLLNTLQSELKTFSKWDAEMLLDLSLEHRILNFVSLQELIDFNTILPWEPIYEEDDYNNVNNFNEIKQINFANDALDQEVLEILNLKSNKGFIDFNDLHNGITTNLQKGDLTINYDKENAHTNSSSNYYEDDIFDEVNDFELEENMKIRSGIPILNNMINTPELLPKDDLFSEILEYNDLDIFRQQLGGIGGYGAVNEEEISEEKTQAKKLLLMISDIINYQNQPAVLKTLDINLTSSLQLEFSLLYNKIISFLNNKNEVELKPNYFENVYVATKPRITLVSFDKQDIKSLVLKINEFINYCKIPEFAQIYKIGSFKNLEELEMLSMDLVNILK